MYPHLCLKPINIFFFKKGLNSDCERRWFLLLFSQLCELNIQLITYRAKLLNADWLRERPFFLNHEGTFGNQDGIIT